MGCGTSFVKYVLFFFNLVVALFGLAVVGVGVAVLLKWAPITNELKSHLTVAPWVFIVIGGVMFVIAFFGCCGAIRESHCMTVTYAIFLLIIIIVQVILGVLMFMYADSIKEALVKTVSDSFRHRDRDASNVVFQNLERQLQCCGNNGPQDYANLILPDSCCPTDASSILSAVSGSKCTYDIASQYPGCGPKIADLYERYNKTIAGIAIGIACVEVVGALFALCLANSIRNMDRRSRY